MTAPPTQDKAYSTRQKTANLQRKFNSTRVYFDSTLVAHCKVQKMRCCMSDIVGVWGRSPQQVLYVGTQWVCSAYPCAYPHTELVLTLPTERIFKQDVFPPTYSVGGIQRKKKIQILYLSSRMEGCSFAGSMRWRLPLRGCKPCRARLRDVHRCCPCPAGCGQLCGHLWASYGCAFTIDSPILLGAF